MNLRGELHHVSEWYNTLPDGQKSPGTFIATRMYYARNSTDSKPTFYGSCNENDYDLVKEFKSEMIRPSDQVKRHYTHWLAYLFANAKSACGQVPTDVWNNRQVVMVVPNNWDLAQRILLKGAIVDAEWVASDREKNIKFLRECEATLHCLIKDQEWMSQDHAVWLYLGRWFPSLTIKLVQAGNEFIILDAGHISYDVALYRVEKTNPLRFREKAGKPPESELITFFFWTSKYIPLYPSYSQDYRWYSKS